MKIKYLVLVAIAIPLFAGPATFQEDTPVLNHEALHAPRSPYTRQGDTLKYDYGTFTSGLGITGSGSPGADETYGFATYFVLSDFGITDPRKVGSILLNFNSTYGTDFRLYVWDAAGGVPNSHGTHLYSDMAAPLGTPGTWAEYDLSASDITLPDTFWVGICYNVLSNPSDWYLAYDGATPDDHTYGNLTGGPGGDWVPLGTYGYGYVYGVRVVVEPTSGPTAFWDFETGWQGWTHTSGQTFPAAWGVVETTYPGGYYWTYQPPPDAGDSAFIIDSDSAGVGVWCVDTAMSPVVANPGYTLLKWGFFVQNDAMQVLLREYDGGWGSWYVVASYSGTTGPAWDSADVTGYTGDSLQVAFQYDDGNGWLYGATFDNVGFYVPAAHDVGTSDIAAPAPSVAPGASIDPIATYNNYGGSQETFDCYFKIDSAGTPLYNQTTSVTLDAGTDTTITWPTWTAGPVDGITYDVMAYTVLGGDANPANDTLTSTTVTASAYWEILDPPAFPTPSSGHSMGTAHDGYYYVFSTGAGNETQIYDIEANSWAAGASNSYGLCYYGSVDYVDGYYYRTGGYDGVDATNRIEIYDPVGDSWSSGAAAPGLLIDHASGVFNDSLVFCFGGGNWFSSLAPTTAVRFYDTYADAWTTATSFPGVGRGCLAGSVIDTFAIVACGYDGAAMRTDYIVGIIDAANPATIAWGSAQTIPGTDSLYRIPYGVDNWNKELWITCGQKWTDQINETWSYSPYTNVWTNWNKPKPQVIANITPVVITKTAGDGDLGLFVAGGYYLGAPVSDHEVLHSGKDTLGIAEEDHGDPGVYFGFAPHMPNPTRGYQPISYTTTTTARVSLKVYDQAGRLVKTLVDRVFEPAGAKTVYWNGKDDAGRTVSNGIYFAQLESEGKTATHKLIIVK